MVASAMTAASVHADPYGNNESINQTESEEPGSETGAGAIAGTANAFNVAVAPQNNVQVVAVWDGTEDNCTQEASNDATINQDAAASSGDATADGGSLAASGQALAGNIAVAAQSNVQVIVGSCGDGVTQIASNDADIDQLADADTGDAEAEAWSTAESGYAASLNADVTTQHNEQIYVDPGVE
jgi:uncharacterized Zn-binding protein involved in type VI secretion